MSCHDIGHGMNSVAKIVIKMYDEKRISQDVTLELMQALQDGVNWCDGNSYEAVECIYYCRCGKCLKKFDKAGLYSIYHISSDYRNNWKLSDEIEENIKPLASPNLCADCFDNAMNICEETKGKGKEIREKQKNS